MLSRIFFPLLVKLLSILDKYRAEYYAVKYKGQFELGILVSMAFGTSVNMIYENKKSIIKIGKRTTFRKYCIITLDGESELLIGENNFFNNNCSINCIEYLRIGDNNLFGENVKIYDHNHKFRDSKKIIIEQGFSVGKIVIGNNCWIGSNTIILSNVEIGDNVVIGANNLIYRSIPSNTVVKSNSSYTLEGLY